MPSEIRIGLPRLLGLSTLDRFFESIWERSTRLTPAVLEDLVAEILSRDQFEILMASAPSGTAAGLSIIEGHVARPLTGGEGDPALLSVAYEAYRRGCSLLQPGLHLRWPPIASICREIENELISHGILLLQAVAANAYLTPADAQAFDIHYDNHCAFILQLHGRKLWTVFPPNEELPVARCEKAIPRDQLSAPLLEAELAAGDVLYVPRGFPHVASTSGTSSLHLTLSLWTMTWLEVVNGLCRENPAFRRSLGPASTPQEHFERHLKPQLLRLEAGSFVERRRSECLALLRPKPDGRLRAIDEAKAVGAGTPVLRASQVLCAVGEEDGQAVLRFPGATLRLPAVMKPVFVFIAANEEFTASELPSTEAPYDAVELTRVLVNRGLVHVKAQTEASRPVDGVLMEEI